jgi:hypothetical protein
MHNKLIVDGLFICQTGSILLIFRINFIELTKKMLSIKEEI